MKNYCRVHRIEELIELVRDGFQDLYNLRKIENPKCFLCFKHIDIEKKDTHFLFKLYEDYPNMKNCFIYFHETCFVENHKKEE